MIPYEKRENDFCCGSCSATYCNITYKDKYDNARQKRKKEKIVHKRRKAHNKLLDTKYKQFNMPHIDTDCCLVCGQLNCTNPFCKEHGFIKLINLYKVGFDTSTIGTTRVFEEFDRIKSVLYREYWVNNLSLAELCEKYGNINYTSFMNIMDCLGIKRRSLSESIRNAHLTGRLVIHDTSKSIFNNSGHHISWEGIDVFLRSSYEFDYANYLDDNKIRYSVESIRIMYHDSILSLDRVAVPDFYLPDTNEIIEIKSDYTLNIQEMLDKFDAYKKLGYNPRLILEHEEIDLYNIESLISPERLERIKTQNIKTRKINK